MSQTSLTRDLGQPGEAGAPPSPAKKLGPVGITFAAVGGVLLVAMMALTVCDVIGRYMLNAPITGAAELTEILLCAVIYLGLCAVSLDNSHVVVDLVTDKLPHAVQPARRALTGLFAGAVLFVVAWRVWVYAAQIGGYGGSTTNLAIPVAPLGYFCAICAAIGGVITVAMPLMALRAPR